MLVRVPLVAGCLAVAVLLAASLRAHDACLEARRDLFGAAIGRLPAEREGPALAVIGRRCRGTEGMVAASAALERQGRTAEALALAYRATRGEPRSATAWNAFAVAAAAAGRRDLAARAGRQAHALSPLGQAPVPAPGGALPPPAAAGGP